MSPSEKRKVQLQVDESNWDEGVIRHFMDPKRQAAQGEAWDLEGGHTLLLYSTPLFAPPRAEILRTLGQMLGALGTPRPFTVILWWRDDPRILSADAWPTRREVNGGWTHQNSSLICVYRAEEWERVVLHEMIHALGWDWPHMPETALPCWRLPTSSSLTPALFEAWTELLAEWIWCGFRAAASNRQDVWERQRAWQDQQAIQILARAPAGAAWKENTSVWAYYVLKAALAPHMPYLWVFVDVPTPEVLCGLTAEPLARLRAAAARTRPRQISLQMTHSTQK